MLISNTLVYEVILTMDQLEDMLYTSGVDEGRISPNNKIMIKSINHDTNSETLAVEFQVYEKQDA